VLTVRTGSTDNVLGTSRAYGPDEQHHPSKNPVEVEDVQRFARVHGRHREKLPNMPTMPDLTEGNLALLEDSLQLSEGLSPEAVSSRHAYESIERLLNSTYTPKYPTTSSTDDASSRHSETMLGQRSRVSARISSQHFFLPNYIVTQIR
jgi:hypothetical protein